MSRGRDTGKVVTPLASGALYGDGIQSVGGAINGYVSYDNGRFLDERDFKRATDHNQYEHFMTYDRSTGSVLLNQYTEVDGGGLEKHEVLLAHVDGAPKLNLDHFEFLVM